MSVRQHICLCKSTYVVDAEEATYTDGGVTRTVRLQGYDQGDASRHVEGTTTVYDAAQHPDDPPQTVYVTRDGSTGFLEPDYQDLLDGQYTGLYRGAAIWIAAWSLVTYALVLDRRRRQLARDLPGWSVRRLAVAFPVGELVLLGLLWLSSYALQGAT